MNRASKDIALCGLLCALAVAVMCLGGLIPAATFCCPVLASLALLLARPRVETRLVWAMYAAIAILSLLLSPDKEAAAIFLALGYYPIVLPALERKKPLVRWCAKLALFYAAVSLAYAVLLFVLRPAGLMAEFDEMGRIMAASLLALGGAVFVLYDAALRVLERRLQMRQKGKRV